MLEGELVTRLGTLRTQPFIDNSDLFRLVITRSFAARKEKEVDVDRIVAAPTIKNWGSPWRGTKYLVKMVDAISQGSLDLSTYKPLLFEYYGIYGVDIDGQHRVISAKALDLTIIPADVLPLSIKKVHARSPREMLQLFWRRHKGLWQGELHLGKSPISWNFPYYAMGRVDSFVGPWVFASDMNAAKRVFD